MGSEMCIRDRFRRLGTRWVSFTGGEPLLRNDLGRIIIQAKRSGMFVSVSSNGRLIPEKVNQLIGIDRVKLSLDGPQHINDQLRGAGSFSAVEEAIRVCKDNNIKVCLECVISRFNLEYIDWLFDYVSSKKVKILFQPATENLLWSNEPNPVIAPITGYKKIINHLIEKKKKHAPILNSLAGLRHLSYWPEPKKIYCSGGLLSFDVEPDGTILACDRAYRELSGRPQNGLTVKGALQSVKQVKNCRSCWCSSVVEINLISSFNIATAINVLKNN